MHGPPVVAWLLVALSAATAVSCLLRERARAEAVMGGGMALMAVPMSVLDPRPWGPPLLAAVFAGSALWAMSRACPHRVHHAVGSAAMAYMALAMHGMGPVHGPHAGHAGHAGAGLPALTGALLLYFAGYVLIAGGRLAVAPTTGRSTGVPLHKSAEVAVACRVSMALGMVAMLLTM